MTDFAAIDFETANQCRSSVCSVGVVVVRGGELVDRFYKLIKPSPNFYSHFCTSVHGLTNDDTDDAAAFPEVWAEVAPRVAGLPFVAHNSRFDESCLRAVFEKYGMEYPGYRFCCTFVLRGENSGAPCPTTSCKPWLRHAAMFLQITIMRLLMPRRVPR